MCLIPLSLWAQKYVDLGLKSGTLWKSENEVGFYTYEQAMQKFGSSLPTKKQLEELKNSCRWTWNGSGYNVTGQNGNSIVLPTVGFRTCSGDMVSVGSLGYYWSSTPYASNNEWCLSLLLCNSREVIIGTNDKFNRCSVRLVQD